MNAVEIEQNIEIRLRPISQRSTYNVYFKTIFTVYLLDREINL